MSSNVTGSPNLVIYTDGGARGNPGPAGTGWVVMLIESGAEIILKKCGNYLGSATNNHAEYQALVEALTWVSQNLQPLSVRLKLDSELVVKQLRGEYRVKSESLLPLYQKARGLLAALPNTQIYHIPREKNHMADKLVNLAIDRRSSVS